MGFMQGKRALIVGIASQRSIAWGIAEAMYKQGAELAFTYQSEKLRSRVEDAAAEFGGGPVLPCDVAHDSEIDAVMAELQQRWGSLDVLVHSVGFAPREALDGQFLDNLTRENIMKQASNVKPIALPLLLPGMTASTTPTDFRPLKQLQLQKWDGKNWVRFGEIIGAKL